MTDPGPSIVDRLPRRSVWMTDQGPYANVALTSRVRLARNIDHVPFPARATIAQLRSVEERVAAVWRDESALADFEYCRLEDLSPAECWGLADRYITSRQHITEPEGRALLFDRRGCVSVLVNEEDHLRIQCLFPGLQLETAWHVADQMDGVFDRRLPMSFDRRWGYLTACPTNVGTGLRASVMLHLPALCLLDRLQESLESATGSGMTVRGFHGEGSEGPVAVQQLSNQITLGLTEPELVTRLTKATVEIAERETQARAEIRRAHTAHLIDRIARSLGLLRFARSMSSSEALEHLSWLRYGVEENLVRGIDRQTLNELWVWIQPGAQQMAAHRNLEPEERDVARARWLRERLAEVALNDD